MTALRLVVANTHARPGFCWGHGATRVGFGHLEMATCSRCGTKLRWKRNDRSDGVLWFEGEAMCVNDARSRHHGCPCGFRNPSAAGKDGQTDD